jgi:hypothetical protein
MVVRMNIRRSIQKTLNYNEAKVRAGVGELLLASGFGCEIGELNFHEKLRRFQELNEHAMKINANTLHISVNFPAEEDLPPELLQRLAIDYMDRIGFGEQPFLVYQHFDARHPHLHIVTTSVRRDGTGIELNNIGRDLSEPAREALEQEYGLIRARGRNTRMIDPHETPSLTSKVQEVTSSYKYTSLDELNSILAQFGMTAWRGAHGSGMFNNCGLVYSRIDEDGNRIGVPVKSSKLATWPTLDWLEKRFEINQFKKLACRDRVAQNITAALRGLTDPTTIVHRLKQRMIHLRPKHDDAGNLTSLSFIDHRSKTVFTAEELGLNTSALLARLTPGVPSPDTTAKTTMRPSGRTTAPTPALAIVLTQLSRSLLATTVTPGPAGDDLPKRKKRKKRRF